MNIRDRIRAAREAGMVERCHTLPHVRGYDVARHTYGVVCILRLVWPEARDLLDFALFHDLPERWTGDIPAPVLRSNDGIRAVARELDELICSAVRVPTEHVLDGVDRARLKGADRLDFWLWTYEEEALGNRMILGARAEVEKHIYNDPNTPEEILALMDGFREEGWQRLKETI